MSKEIFMIARTKCRKCGVEVIIDFCGLDYDGAVATLEKFDRIPRECHGFHVELSGWWYYWNFDELLRQAYPEQHLTNLRDYSHLYADEQEQVGVQ